MKAYILLFFLLCAFAVSVFSLFGDNSYARLERVQESVSSQQSRNEELERKVIALQEQIKSLQTNSRTLEIEARERTGMARPNELIFKFEK